MKRKTDSLLFTLLLEKAQDMKDRKRDHGATSTTYTAVLRTI